MPRESYAAKRSDGHHIGKDIREMVRLMAEDGQTWQRAADAVGLDRQRAYRALHKPHVIAYRRQQRKEQIELLSTRVPHKLSALMDSDNAAAAVRAALALEEMSNQSRAEPPLRRIQTGGIVIMLGAGEQQALPVAAPALELQAIESIEAERLNNG